MENQIASQQQTSINGRVSFDDIPSVDVLEQIIYERYPKLLDNLLKDKTTQRYILWGTKDYEKNGTPFFEDKEIKPGLITGDLFSAVIQPRAVKPLSIRKSRIRDKAEVFTPSWICNKQNNSIDELWFGRKEVFNTEEGRGWNTNCSKIEFTNDKTWKDYVLERRLEITCGEAPYLVSRYDTTTATPIPVQNRIGLLDRKLRVVTENATDDEEWLQWTIKAFQSVYGYEFQGDSLLIARENLLYTFIDYYLEHFHVMPTLTELLKIANIIVWNIWQMDGLKGIVPFSETDVTPNGILCKINDWTTKGRESGRSHTYNSTIRGDKKK